MSEHLEDEKNHKKVIDSLSTEEYELLTLLYAGDSGNSYNVDDKLPISNITTDADLDELMRVFSENKKASGKAEQLENQRKILELIEVNRLTQ